MCGDLVSNHGTTGRASIERAEARPSYPILSPSLGAMSVLVQTNPTQPNPTDSLSFGCTSASQPTALPPSPSPPLPPLPTSHPLLYHPRLATHCYLPPYSSSYSFSSSSSSSSTYYCFSSSSCLRPSPLKPTPLQPSQPVQTHLHALGTFVVCPRLLSRDHHPSNALRYISPGPFRNLGQFLGEKNLNVSRSARSSNGTAETASSCFPGNLASTARSPFTSSNLLRCWNWVSSN